GAEVEDLASPLDADGRVLGGDEDALVLVEALLAQLSRAGGQIGEEVRVHGPALYTVGPVPATALEWRLLRGVSHLLWRSPGPACTPPPPTGGSPWKPPAGRS